VFVSEENGQDGKVSKTYQDFISLSCLFGRSPFFDKNGVAAVK
jgi:hypothetical protein